MGDPDFVRETIQALNSHAAELDAMYRALTAAVKNLTEIPNIKEIFQEIWRKPPGNAMSCSKYIMAMKIQIRADVRRAIQRVLDGLSNCAGAFVAYMSIARLTLG